MGQRLGPELVPDGLWEIVEPLIPPQRERPQGGGTRFVEDRAVFTAIVYVLTTGCAWRHLPAEFGVSPATAHRRFAAWTEAGLWRRLHRAVLDRLGERPAVLARQIGQQPQQEAAHPFPQLDPAESAGDPNQQFIDARRPAGRPYPGPRYHRGTV